MNLKLILSAGNLDKCSIYQLAKKRGWNRKVTSEFSNRNNLDKCEWDSNNLKIFQMPSLLNIVCKKTKNHCIPLNQSLCLTFDCFLVIAPSLGKSNQTVVRVQMLSNKKFWIERIGINAFNSYLDFVIAIVLLGNRKYLNWKVQARNEFYRSVHLNVKHCHFRCAHSPQARGNVIV